MSSGKKVFVGNLNYDTTEEDLKNAFSKAGKVVEAKVVRRGYRSKGYGFVEFETEEGAKKAVEVLDKSSLNDRDINVQVSTSTGTKVGSVERSGNGNAPPRRSYNNNYGGGYRGPSNYGGGYRNQGGYQGGRSPGRGNQRRVYFLRNNYDNGNNRRFSNRGPYRGGNYERRGGQNTTFTKQVKKTNVEKIESKTTVFVANLPFAVNDEDLIKLFDKCGPIKTAHVVKNKGRSKGYGFIEFENNEGQAKALKEMDNHMVPYKNGEEKPLSVKVAMAEVEKHETKNENETETETETKDE
jgi:RNA recognition motif-containing protein